MYITMKSALAIIKNKKMQSILIGIIIMLISALLYIGVSMVSQDSSFEDMADRANATETLIIMTEKGEKNQDIVNWYLENQEIDGVLVYQTDMLECGFGNAVDEEITTLFVTEYNNDGSYDHLYIDENTIASPPKEGEVMVNYNFAKNRGIDIGDKINISVNGNSVELIISSLVVDTQFSSPFLSPNRCFVNASFFDDNHSENQMEIISVKYNDITKINDQEMYEQCLLENNAGSNAIFLGYSDIKSTYSIIFSIIAAVLIAVSLVIFVIVVFVIRSTVQNLIRQRYKEIGVQKAIGYTSKQIRNSLLMVYCVIGIIASILGSAAALPIRNIINRSISYDMQININASIDLFLFINIGIVIALLAFFTMIATKKAANVKPVQAIKYGMEEQDAATTAYSFKGRKGDLGMLLSIKQLLGNWKKTFSLVLLLTLLTFGGFLIRNVGTTLASSKHFASNMFGIEIGDFSLQVDENVSSENVIKEVKELEGVGDIIFIMYSISESFEDTNESNHSISGLLIEGNLENYLLLKTGRAPINKNEVVISENVSIESGKGVGDYINITAADEHEKYLVTGIYNSISSSGYSYAKKIDNSKIDVKSSYGYFWGYFNGDSLNLEDLERDIENKLSTEAKVTEYDNDTLSVLITLESFPFVVNIILIIFLFVSAIILLNSTIMDINSSVKIYGIMKATGFSKEFISRMLVIRSIVVTITGMIVGFTACILSMNAIMAGVFKLTPFSTIRMPVIFDGWGCLFIGILFIVTSIASPLIATKKLDKITPKQLIAE